jgi:hypothetical protein
VTFLFNPDGDASPKALHVSPFMDMQNTWYVPALLLLVAIVAGGSDYDLQRLGTCAWGI